MVRLSGMCLVVVVALLAAGCVVGVASPTISATAPLVTSTRLPPGAASATRAPNTATALSTPLSVVTPTQAGATTQDTTAANTTPPLAASPSQTATDSAGPTAAQTLAATLPAPESPSPSPSPTPTHTPTPALAIILFAASPAEIRPGEPVTLTWQLNAEEATIYRVDLRGRLGEWYSVGLSGTLMLETSPALRGSLDFLLYASAGGAQANARASVNVTCPDTYFFANPPSSCPIGPAQPTLIQAQHFERGHMLWTQATDRIYILYADGGVNGWGQIQNAWFAGQPESDPALTPPEGLFQPVRGFGLAWRVGYGAPSPPPRDRLGWATGEEFSVSDGFFQCEYSAYPRCFITGPASTVYVLEPEHSAWRVWQGE